MDMRRPVERDRHMTVPESPRSLSQPLEIEIASDTIRPARIVTARSFFIDRFVPDCEILALPAKEIPGGRLSARRAARSVPRSAGRRGLLSRRPAAQVIEGRPIFDARRRTPGNWAHFLNNHLPILFRLCAAYGLDPSDVVVVTPAETPRYIADAAAVFGLDILATDAPVEGCVLDYEPEPWTGIRAARANWVRTADVQARLARGLAEAPPPALPLPRKVFLSRADTRRLSNEAEIEALLEGHGFRKIYAERLSAADQFRLILQAEGLVAIHGAALAPLLYRTTGHGLRLVELMPCGHMSDVYRVMAQQVGCDWIGVRGKVKPAYVEAAYRLDTRFDAFSLDDFDIDAVSLERALDMKLQPATGEMP
jgi:hypothetical protein